MKSYRKKILTAVAAATLTLFATTSQAQVFLMGNDNNSREIGKSTEGLMVPNYNEDIDQGNSPYLPLGSGAWLLAGFAGAYLLGKKKKK